MCFSFTAKERLCNLTEILILFLMRIMAFPLLSSIKPNGSRENEIHIDDCSSFLLINFELSDKVLCLFSFRLGFISRWGALAGRYAALCPPGWPWTHHRMPFHSPTHG